MKKLLLIDDDPFSKKLLVVLFRNEWKVISETLPDAVTQRIEEEVPRVVLLNASDKRVESEALFDAIHKTHPSLPIIVYTNLSGLRVGRSMLKKGAFWHLSMPLNTDELTHVIQIALSFQQHRESALATRRDFDSLEKGIARMFQPLKGSFPKLFTFDQDGLLQGIVDLLADILQVDKVSLMLLNPDTGEMRIKAARGLSPYVIEHTTKRVGEGIAGWVAREGKPLLIKDVQHDPQFSESAFYHQYTTRSLICVPLKIEDRVIGVLSANNKFSGEPFDEDDLYLGTIFAHLLLLTLHNAQLHHDRERELQREAQIGTLNRKISATLEPKVLFHILLNECCNIFQAPSALFFHIDERGDQCIVYCLNDGQFTESELPPTMFKKWAATRNGPGLASSVDGSEATALVKAILNQEVGSWISVPVILQEKLTGSLELISPEIHRFREADKQALQRVGQQASLAVSNARLYLKLLNSIKEISDARKEVERVRRNQFL